MFDKINLKQVVVVFALPILIFIVDLILRWDFFSVAESDSILLFSFSFFYELIFYTTIFFLISKSKRYKFILILIFSTFLILFQIIVYEHYNYFGVTLNNYSLNFFLKHPLEAFSLTASSINLIHILIFFGVILFYFFLINKSVRILEILSKKFIKIVLFSFFLLTAVFQNNVRFSSASYSFTPSNLFSIVYVIRENLFDENFLVHRGYVKRKFEIKDKIISEPKYNFLIILSESVRKNNYSAYNYNRKTTPFLDELIKNNSVILFKNHFSNSVSTQYSNPILLSGNFTLERLNHPFIYDYLKKWLQINTFFFSPQAMKTTTFDQLYNSTLDNFVFQEMTNLNRSNDLGVDDKEFLEINLPNLINKQNKYFGIYQFNNTHFPYNISKYSKKIFEDKTSKLIDKYDDAILEQDNLIRKIFNQLESNNLLDSTIILFTSDHGEAFGERGRSGHLQTLYNEEVAVPMWIYLPKDFNEIIKQNLFAYSNSNTSHLDILPTILDFYGLLDSAKLNYLPIGNSLLQPINHNRKIPLIGFDMLETEGFVQDSLKFLFTKTDNKTKYEVYNFKTDAQEKINLWNSFSQKDKSEFINSLNLIRSKRLSYKINP